MFFKKKNEEIYSPSAGTVIELEKVEDPVFSQKIMGDGFSVKPSSSEVFSPVEGVISNIFPTKHAIGVKTKNGLEILIHIGINTVELNGEGFNIFAKEGNSVTPQTKLVEIDPEILKKNGYSSDIMVIITNMDKVNKFIFQKKGVVNCGETIGTVSIK